MLVLQVVLDADAACGGVGNAGSRGGQAAGLPAVKVVPLRRVCSSESETPVSLLTFVFPAAAAGLGGDGVGGEEDGAGDSGEAVSVLFWIFNTYLYSHILWTGSRFLFSLPRRQTRFRSQIRTKREVFEATYDKRKKREK